MGRRWSGGEEGGRGGREGGQHLFAGCLSERSHDLSLLAAAEPMSAPDGRAIASKSNLREGKCCSVRTRDHTANAKENSVGKHLRGKVDHGLVCQQRCDLLKRGKSCCEDVKSRDGPDLGELPKFLGFDVLVAEERELVPHERERSGREHDVKKQSSGRETDVENEGGMGG
eukprot:169800-Rhodomonas_salina.2